MVPGSCREAVQAGQGSLAHGADGVHSLGWTSLSLRGWSPTRPVTPQSVLNLFLPQMERVQQWEARQLQSIEEATQHELTVEDD